MTDPTLAPTLDVEVAEVEDLVEDPRNARRHTPRNLDSIAGSLDRFGQQKPIVVHRDVVIAGNGTLAAARTLGWTRLAVVRDDSGGVQGLIIGDGQIWYMHRTRDVLPWA